MLGFRLFTPCARMNLGCSMAELSAECGECSQVRLSDTQQGADRTHGQHAVVRDLPRGCLRGLPGLRLQRIGIWRQFTNDAGKCRKADGEDALPAIRLRDLRHSHATLLLAREPVHVVSQRLRDANPVVTVTMYAYALPVISAMRPTRSPGSSEDTVS